MSLNTLDLYKIISPFQKSDIFKGVFACDNLPKTFSVPAAFVVNLSKEYEQGSHWIGIFISKNRVAEYFDSFGFSPRGSHILSFIKTHSRKLIFNKKQIQHIVSIKCGKFVALFILCKLLDKDFESIINRFSYNLSVNEIVLENIFKYFNECRRTLIYKTF